MSVTAKAVGRRLLLCPWLSGSSAGRSGKRKEKPDRPGLRKTSVNWYALWRDKPLNHPYSRKKFSSALHATERLWRALYSHEKSPECSSRPQARAYDRQTCCRSHEL